VAEEPGSYNAAFSELPRKTILGIGVVIGFILPPSA
jgi:hypothetical protein